MNTTARFPGGKIMQVLIPLGILVVWLVIGLAIYFAYGRAGAARARKAKPGSRTRARL